MLFVSISNPKLVCFKTSFGQELRLDLFPTIEFGFIETVLKEARSPILLTLRKTPRVPESERGALLERLLALHPPFFDVEWDMDPEFLRNVMGKYPKTKFILSYHNFEKTPDDLEGLYRSMSQFPAYSYKIAAMANTTNDALKMLLLAKKYQKVSAICMGERGEFARVLGPCVGNLVNYCCLNLENKTAPGQLSLGELMDIYHYPSLNPQTAIYGLIGDPVEKSPGHKHHNGVFRRRGINAVYVKMRVLPEELAEFIPLAKALPIKGLSVTIPLKEKILPFLDQIEPGSKPISAINTLRFEKDKIWGTNTDGFGALDAIEKKGVVRGKKVVLLGAGGAARAIAFEAKRRGAHVVILNRTLERGHALANELTCVAGGLEDVPEDYEVMINCSPDPMPIEEKLIRKGTVAMDVVYAPRETVFLQAAMKKECQIVYGEEMYLNQAAGQTAFWVDA